MSSIIDIAEGTINNLLKREEELFKKRIKICRSCKLHKIDSTFGEVCNRSLYLNPIENKVSDEPKYNYFRGCGCILQSKCRLPRAVCPAGRW